MSGVATTPQPGTQRQRRRSPLPPPLSQPAPERGGPVRAPHRNQPRGGQLVAGRGFRLRVPELIPRRWPSSSSPLPNALPRGPNAAPDERLEKPGVGGPAGGRASGRRDSTPAPRPPRLQGKFLAARGAGPWAGATQVQRAPDSGRPQKSHQAEAGSAGRRPERPFWAGSALGAEGGAEVVSLARCRQVPARTRALRRSRAAVARSLRSFPWETWRLALGRQGAVLLRPLPSAVPVPRPPRGGPRPGTGGHNSSEAAVTPGGSRCPCTGNTG